MDINATLLGHVIWFAVFIWLTMKYVWPPLEKAMQERKKEIAEGLASAEKSKLELENASKQSKEIIDDAKIQASEIISKAEKRGSQIIDEAKVNAKDEAQKIKETAQNEISQELNKAREGLRSQVSTLVVLGASKILQKEVNKEKHNDLLKDIEMELVD